MGSVVKAAVMVAPGRMQIREFPFPALEDGAALLKVEMCGICGTDKHTWRGETSQYAGTAAETSTPFPIIPGHEIVGTIAELNDRRRPRLDFDGQRLRVGDRVAICPDVVCGQCYQCRHTFAFPWCENLRGYGNSLTCATPPHLFGGWAEYLYVLPEAFLYRVPQALPLRVAVMSELMAVSYNLDKVREFSTLAGEGFATGCTVVIQGAGCMGVCHLIKARVMGAGCIVATDLSEFRLGLARQFGADHTLDVGRTTAAERIEFVRDLTRGRGADIVVECAGVPEVVSEGLEMTRKGGVYIEAGNFVDTGEVLLNPHRHFCARNIRLLGMTNHPFTGYTPSMELLQREAGRFPFERFVTHEYPLAQAEAAVLQSLETERLKVVSGWPATSSPTRPRASAATWSWPPGWQGCCGRRVSRSRSCSTSMRAGCASCRWSRAAGRGEAACRC
jgi:threonine dehydrogenase-like Zn-dependent dehydrogenase